jgi:hypothetical protein
MRRRKPLPLYPRLVDLATEQTNRIVPAPAGSVSDTRIQRFAVRDAVTEGLRNRLEPGTRGLRVELVNGLLVMIDQKLVAEIDRIIAGGSWEASA